MKKIYFSSYVDVKNIQMNPEFFDEPEHDEILHRFSLTIPFRERDGGGQTIVIMKNLSNAGKQVKAGP